MTQYYARIYCYRIQDWSLEDAIIDSAVLAGGHVEYRCDCLDIFVPESAAHTAFYLQWMDHIEYLDWLDYHRGFLDS